MYLHDYYRHPAIIKRMLEYCGVPNWITERADIGYPSGYGPLRYSHNLKNLAKLMSAQYLVEYGVNVPDLRKYRSMEVWQLGEMLDRQVDIFRSLHDRNSLVCVLDIERVNHHRPGDNYVNMVGAFWNLEPFHQALMHVFRRYGFTPLVLATGQGYHYSFRIPKDEHAYTMLQSIGFVTESERKRNLYRKSGSRRKRIVTDDEAWAYDGWGKVAEFIVNQAMLEAPRFGNKLPVVIGDQYVPTKYGDVISADLSAFGSTLFMRDVRVVFSLHQKHKTQPGKVGWEVATATPLNLCVPRYTPCNGHELELDDLFHLRRENYQDTANYAQAITTEIPVMSWAMENTIRAYRDSDLGRAHAYFDQGMNNLTFNYRDSFTDLPFHVREALWHPFNNQNQLLKPDIIRDVTLCLLRKKWHPASIVGLIAGKYQYFGLDVDWSNYCPIKWASGWVRAMYGQTVTGTIDWRNTVDW